MHPAAPEDLHGLVDAYAGTAQAVVDLTFSLSEADFDRPTPCPGWTVKDQVSHVVSLEAAMLGRPDPHVEVPDYPHIRNDMGRQFEQGVELRRPRPGAEVVAEWQKVLAGRLGRLRDPSLTEETLVDTPRGPRTLRKALELRISDIWCHEQDIREALGRPGNLDSRAAAVFVQGVMNRLPQIVVERVGLEPGKVLMIELTGPVIARSGVRVEVDDDGKPVGRLMFAGASDETGPIPVIGKTTSLQMSTEVFTRRAAGRRATEGCAYSVHGDPEIARSFMDHLAVTP